MRLPGAAGFAALAGLALLALLLAFAGFVATLAAGTPDISDIRRLRVERPSVLLAADGQVIGRFQRLNREWVGLDKVAPSVIDALIATEDRRFYVHHGIDLRRSLMAAAKSLAGERQGGSTLTQQLARNLFPREVGRAPTLRRKLKEALTALKLERTYSKRQILELYLNTATFLYNANGIELAARTYFDTSAARLDPAQAATLVGMLKGTSAYNPVRNPERALARRNLVLAQMAEEGRLSQTDFENLRRRPLGLSFTHQDSSGPAPHFADQVHRLLDDWAEREGLDLEADGLVIETTLDARLQALATQVVERQTAALQAVADVEWSQPSARLLSTRIEAYAKPPRGASAFAYFWSSRPELLASFIRESPEFERAVAGGQSPEAALAALRADGDFLARLKAEKSRLQAGLVALDPATGEVRAWVGSRGYAEDSYDHVAQARRQPGSTFKAFTYAAALEAGMAWDRPFVDGPVAIRLSDGRVWRPGDMAGPSGAVMSLEDGLVYSKNSITAQVVAEIGASRVAELARRVGVRESRLDPVPSLALGTSPVSLLEMASAYSTIARSGDYLPPVLVRRVLDRDGHVLMSVRPAPEHVLGSDIAVQLIEFLRAAVERGTGRGLRPRFGIDADVAGKTGTSQNNADGWFILMHPQLVTGAWVGFNDQRVQMRSNYWGQGAHTALYLVGDFFRESLASGEVDAAARFPKWLPPAPPMYLRYEGAPDAESEEASEGLKEAAPEAGAEPEPAPVVVASPPPVHVDPDGAAVPRTAGPGRPSPPPAAVPPHEEAPEEAVSPPPPQAAPAGPPPGASFPASPPAATAAPLPPHAAETPAPFPPPPPPRRAPVAPPAPPAPAIIPSPEPPAAGPSGARPAPDEPASHEPDAPEAASRDERRDGRGAEPPRTAQPPHPEPAPPADPAASEDAGGASSIPRRLRQSTDL